MTSRQTMALRAGAIYLALQALGAAVWWLILLVVPTSRALFRLSDAPDATLLAFLVPDLIGFIGAGVWASVVLWKSPRRALVPLAFHVGAASYAALYCLSQWLLSGETPWAALLMAPALVVGPTLLWICARA